jgi:hypothetical protein
MTRSAQRKNILARATSAGVPSKVTLPSMVCTLFSPSASISSPSCFSSPNIQVATKITLFSSKSHSLFIIHENSAQVKPLDGILFQIVIKRFAKIFNFIS